MRKLYNNKFDANVHMYNVEKRIHLLWFFKPFPNLSWCNNPQSSAFVGCYTFAGCGNGHSLSVMSETNSRVISLTSRRSRGAKLLRQRGVATVAPTRTAILVPDPRRLYGFVSGTCQRVRIYEVSAPREKTDW